MPAPLIVAAILALVAVYLVVPSPQQARQLRARRARGDQRLAAWAGEVERHIPAAFAVQNVARAGQLEGGKRPVPKLSGRGHEIPYGWRWELDLPGSTIDEDWEGDRVAAAINTGRKLVAVAEIEPTFPGHATLSMWKSDPLSLDNTVPYRPGQLPVDKWGDRWELGRRRDGTHVALPLWLDGGGAFHHLFAGATGSGKTRWMLLAAAHAIQLGAEVYIVDLVKGVDDRDWQPILPAVAGAWDNPDDAVREMNRLHMDTLARPRWQPEDGAPFRVFLFDEVQEFIATKAKGARGSGGLDGAVTFRKMVAELRSKGAAVMAATQLPEVDQIKASARTNLRIKMAGRLDNEQEYRAALGGKWHGTKIPDNPDHWGVGYVDVDGRGAQRFRGWNISDAWLAAHVRACVGQRVG